MDMKPFYELRNRLRSAAIAGTGLIGEDFRLARAVEAMAPFEKASPVFGKIGQLCRQLIGPDTEEGLRGGVLLEALSLLDAVLCTQAAAGTKAELELLPPALCQGEVVVNAPYSVVKRLRDALTTSGGGSFGFIMETRQNSPQLFQDYRVRSYLVKALGAGYSELAEQVTEWLKKDGYDLVPLLMDGFDPKGRKEMVRRIWVLEALAAKSSDASAAVRPGINAFLREQLAEAEKDVRLAVIYALHTSAENAELLLHLAQTERGKAKKAALAALAGMESGGTESVRQFWNGYLEKKPEEALEYLARANSEPAAERILQWQKETGAKLAQELLEQALYISENLRLCEEAVNRYEAAETEAERLQRLPAAVCAKVITEEDCTLWLKQQITKTMLLVSRLDAERVEAFLDGISHLVWEKGQGAYMMVNWVEGAFDGLPRTVRRPAAMKVDEDFLDLLQSCGNKRVRGILWNLDKNRAW